MRVAKRLMVSRALCRLVGPVCAVLVCVLGSVVGGPAARAQDECQPQWAEGAFCQYVLSGPVYAAVAWDDGTGESLYVAGEFALAGCEVVNNIARWDGSNWTTLAGPGGIGVNGIVRALAVFDDGTGPALYIGGDFATAGGVTVNRIAKWDGSTWTALAGPGGAGVNISSTSHVNALSVFDDGSGPALFAAGSFDTAGGVTASNIARWDGSDWSALSGPSVVGVTSSVYAMTVFDDGSGPALYVGGGFIAAGGVPTSRIARWNGNAWSALPGTGSLIGSVSVHALTVFDDGDGPALYVGGTFTSTGTSTVNRIAKWNGSAWSALTGPSGVGVASTVRALAVFDDGSGPALYAGGDFATAGGVFVSRIARWNGTTWSALTSPGGVGVSDAVYALTVFDDDSGPALYAGGFLQGAGGVLTNRIARWNGASWTALADQSPASLSSGAQTMTVFDDGSDSAIYVGGFFSYVGGELARNIARWDGGAWSVLADAGGVGVDDQVRAMTVFDDGSGPSLFVGGAFGTAGGVLVNRLARWDGVDWSALAGPGGVGLNGWVWALAGFDDGAGSCLYAGGEFTTAGGVTVNRIARWDGAAWSALTGPSGVGVNAARIGALKVFDDGSGPALYAGGDFTTAGGVTVNRIARWDGASWSALTGPGGVGVNGQVRALTVFDDGTGSALYVGGDFTTAGGVTFNRIAKWDGSNWSALTGSDGMGVNSQVRALTVFDDGTGRALYVGGGFTTAGGVTVNRIAKWDGISWSVLAGPSEAGVNSGVNALTVFDDGSGPALYAGGDFTTAGGLVSKSMAKWQGCLLPPPVCPPDVNNDGEVDILDFLDFIDSFGTCEAMPAPCAGTSGVSADYNGDTLVDILDLLDFLDAFGTGCD